MRRLLLILLFIFPLQLMAQFEFPDSYKSMIRDSKLKSEMTHYYNPVLDKYNIHFVKLDLEVTDQSTYIQGNVTIQAKATQLLDTLVFDFSNSMSLDSIFINNVKVSAKHSGDVISYIFTSPIPIGENVITQIYYHGTAGAQGGGVTHDYDSGWGKNVTWTLSESFHAYEWWPCKQVLSDKIDSAYMFFTCDDDCMVGSNGLLTNVVNLPESKKRFEWKTYYPIDYYLISYAVSEYQDYSLYANPEGSSPILIQNFIYNSSSCLNQFKSDIDKTASFIELYSEKFGLYPFAKEKYGHCLTTLGGGMEHQTMTTLGDFGYTLVAHELGHMWFGDYVTCATWQDIWINEGFASYTEYVALENLVNKLQANEWMNNAHSRALSEPYGSVYIPFEDAKDENRIFSSSLSYKKGAAIIHMIRHEINNDDLFFKALQNYLKEYGDSVATGDDFKTSIEKTTGIDFDPFFSSWYYGKGFPGFDVTYSQMNDTLYLSVNESTSSSETPLFQMFVDYKLLYSGGDTTLRLYQSSNQENFKIYFDKKVQNLIIDPDNWILNSQGSVHTKESPEDHQNLFWFYPNPAIKSFTVVFNADILDLEKEILILDLNGRLINSYTTKDNLFTMPVSNMVSGLYFIKVNSDGKTYAYKFIKQ